MKVKFRHFDKEGYERDLQDAKIAVYEKKFGINAHKIIELCGELIYPIASPTMELSGNRADDMDAMLTEGAMLLVEQDNYISEVEYDYLGTAIDIDGGIVIIAIKPDGRLEKIKYDDSVQVLAE